MEKYDEPFIHPDTLSCKFEEEPHYEGFVSRHEFINTTGIYVTPMHFYNIYRNFKESDATADEFVENYEEKYADLPVEKINLQGTFKYEMTDVCISGIDRNSEDVYPNIWEIVDALGTAYYAQRKALDEKNEMISEMREMVSEMQRKYLAAMPSLGIKA